MSKPVSQKKHAKFELAGTGPDAAQESRLNIPARRDAEAARVRDVRVAKMPGHEGEVYLLSDESSGGLWRLVPR